MKKQVFFLLLALSSATLAAQQKPSFEGLAEEEKSPAQAAEAGGEINAGEIVARLVALETELAAAETRVAALPEESTDLADVIVELENIARIEEEIGKLSTLLSGLQQTAELDPFEIRGYLADYGGTPLAGPVENGDILAFTAEVTHPEAEFPQLSTLIWQVYDENGYPAEGLGKTERAYETAGTKEYRFKIALDDFSHGAYRVALTHRLLSTPPVEEQAIFPFRISEALKISRVLVTTDPDDQTHMSTLYPDQEPLLYAHYELGRSIDSIDVSVRVTNASNGAEISSHTFRRGRKGVKSNQRVGYMLEAGEVPAGTKAVFEAALTAPGGEPKIKSVEFEVKAYSIEINTPSQLTSGRSAGFRIKVPDNFIAPYKVEVESSEHLTVVHNPGELSGTVSGIADESSEAATLEVTVTGSQGRSASGSKRVVIRPEQEEEEEVAQVTDTQPAEAVSSAPSFDGIEREGQEGREEEEMEEHKAPGKGESEKEQIRLGKEAWQLVLNRIEADLIPSCLQTKPGIVNNFLAEFNKIVFESHIKMFGRTFYSQIGYDVREIITRREYKIDRARLELVIEENKRRFLHAVLIPLYKKMPENECITSQLETLTSMDYLLFQKFEKRAVLDTMEMNAKKYYVEVEWIAGKPPSANRWKRKPYTSIKPYNYGSYVEVEWRFAFGPASMWNADKLSDMINSGEFKLNSSTLPWNVRLSPDGKEWLLNNSKVKDSEPHIGEFLAPNPLIETGVTAGYGVVLPVSKEPQEAAGLDIGTVRAEKAEASGGKSGTREAAARDEMAQLEAEATAAVLRRSSVPTMAEIIPLRQLMTNLQTAPVAQELHEVRLTLKLKKEALSTANARDRHRVERQIANYQQKEQELIAQERPYKELRESLQAALDRKDDVGALRIAASSPIARQLGYVDTWFKDSTAGDPAGKTKGAEKPAAGDAGKTAAQGTGEVKLSVGLYPDLKTVKQKIQYYNTKNGETVRHGKCEFFESDGRIKNISYYTHGKLNKIFFGKSNKTLTLQEDGTWKAVGLYPNSKQVKVRYHAYMKDNKYVLHGKFESFHETGKIAISGQYKHGIKVGLWNYYAPDGSKSISQYDSQSKPHGEISVFEPDGSLRGFLYYNHGKLYKKYKSNSDITTILQEDGSWKEVKGKQ